MNINQNNVRGYITADGVYVVFVENCPKIVGKGKTAEEALEDLIDTYRAIIRTVNALKCD